MDKLKDPEVAAIFEAKVGGRFAALNLLEEDINSLTDNIKDVLQESAAEVLGKRRKKNKPWATDDILDLCDTRRDLKTKRVSPSAAQQYSVVNKHINIRKKMKEAKEKSISDQCDNIEAGMSKGNNCKTAFDTLKAPILQEEVEEAVHSLKEGKSPGDDNVPGALKT